MKKRVIVLLLILTVFLLISCSNTDDKKVIVEDSRNRADETIEKLIEAIKNDDIDGLESIFSNKALREAEDFEENVGYLLDFFQGNVEEWERFRFSGNTSVEDGKKQKV